MTVKAFIARLAQYPEDALCCGTFWLADDFLLLDATLTEDDIDAAMELARTVTMPVTGLTGLTCRQRSMR